ncbi:MAG: ABC transporter permease [Blastocatellia bacterium]|nr:ABC transporter permease [Blastocatellia bacterium]
MERLLQNLRYSVRMLRKNPGFTVVAVLTLALGIGANTAIFSVIDAVLLRPLPFKESERLVAVWSTTERDPQSKPHVSFPDLADWRAQSRSFESLSGWFIYEFTLTGSGEPVRAKGAGVDGDLLALLAVAPELGRTFRPEDDHVVVLGHSLWQRRFNSDTSIVDRNITLNGESYTVVGVMPQGFRFPIEADPVDLWATWDYAKHPGPAQKRDARLFEVIGRLRPSVTLVQAQAELDGIAAALRERYPDTNEDIGARIIPAAENLVGVYRRALLVLFGAVAFVLLIACVNVANLLLAKASGRRREMAVRAALGASRSSLTLQLLTESLLLALAGGALGCLIAMWGVDALIALNPDYLPGANRIGVDGRVLTFTLLASLATGVLFGLAPAWHASKIDLTTALKDSDRTVTEGAGRRRLRSTLVIVEVALSMALLAGAALLINSFWRLRQVDPGFDSRNVLTFRLSLPYEKYDAPQSGEFFRQLQTRLQAQSGVRAASTIFPLPLNGDPVFDSLDASFDMRLDIEGRPVRASERPRVDGRTVQPDYYRAMGIRLAGGRDFNERDDAQATKVAIINETLARLHFPGEDPIGKRIRLNSVFVQGEPPLREIVGIVGDVKHHNLSMETRPEVYVPLAQDPFQEFFVVMKAESDPHRFVGAIRSEVQALDRDLPIYDVHALDERLGAATAQERFTTVLIAIFAALALALTAVGLYSVMSYTVAQRTHEIGIRQALGAQARDVLKLVIGQGAALVSIGAVIGLIASFALTRSIESLLFGVSATDPMTFALVTLLLAGVALAALYIPARRATRVDPVVALRDQ